MGVELNQIVDRVSNSLDSHVLNIRLLFVQENAC